MAKKKNMKITDSGKSSMDKEYPTSSNTFGPLQGGSNIKVSVPKSKKGGK